jgi:uncharacterized protein YgiM (DUF1202 family)
LRRIIHLICLVVLMLAPAACGTMAQAGQQTPILTIQTAPPLPTATVQPTARPTVAPTETATATPLAQVQVTRSVNLRTGPGMDFPVIRTLRVKTTVDLIALRDEHGERWYQARVGDDQGWISGAILKVDASQAAMLPSNTDSFTPPTATPKPTALPSQP